MPKTTKQTCGNPSCRLYGKPMVGITYKRAGKISATGSRVGRGEGLVVEIHSPAWRCFSCGETTFDSKDMVMVEAVHALVKKFLREWKRQK